VIGALRTAAANFRARRGMFLASGLAFNFMVGLIPLLFFFVAVAGFVLSRRTVMDAVLSQLSGIVPVYKNELHEALAAIIRRRRLSGLLGTAVLLLFASQLFNSIRVVLSDIFGFRGGPGFLRGMLRDMVMVVAMGVLFLGSLVISDVFGWLKILLFQTMGIGSEIARKAVLVRGGLSAERVARGEADIAIQQASELKVVPGVRFAGMLPEQIQNYTTYSGAISADTGVVQAATALLAAFSDPSADPILRKRGLEMP